MMIFSPLFPGSGGWADTAAFGPSFSGVDFAAQREPLLKKRATERMIKTKMVFLNFDFIVPPKLEKLLLPPLPHKGDDGRDYFLKI